MTFGLPDQHMVGKRHAEQIGQRTAILDAADRLQTIRRTEGHGSTGVGMTAPTALAITATDLERYDDEIAGRKILHRASDIDNATGGFVAQRERPGQAGLAADNDEIDVAACNRKRLHQRIGLME